MLTTWALMLNPAHAAHKCDGALARAQKASPEGVAEAYANVASCDKKFAEENFTVFMKRATNTDALTALSIAAINHDAWNAVWTAIGKVSDYEARDVVASAVGAQCTENPRIVQFLQGAYAALKGVDFQQWDDAFTTCESEELQAWIVDKVKDPPSSTFDEKYNSLVRVYSAQKGVDALPALTEAAKAAADNGGPYDDILMQIDSAVAPGIGEEMSPEAMEALEQSLMDIGQEVDADKARAVANQLANSGAEDKAAELLPRAFPDRMQGDGSFLWGAASIEMAECKGEKEAVVHVASVTDPGTRWVVLDAIDSTMKSHKARLSKCESEGDWLIVATPEPVSQSKEIGAWADGLAEQWSSKGYEVDVRDEKAIILD